MDICSTFNNIVRLPLLFWIFRFLSLTRSDKRWLRSKDDLTRVPWCCLAWAHRSRKSRPNYVSWESSASPRNHRGQHHGYHLCHTITDHITIITWWCYDDVQWWSPVSLWPVLLPAGASPDWECTHNNPGPLPVIPSTTALWENKGTRQISF